ncbi:MAG TPA: glycosyltransferase family 2 protein, partial [Ruminococcaceae bacterium]|nr:glycosyltransferase family 2 protein [Oscillospiraceae bacterium]
MIDILMAAYNGEKYIGEQIESILRQTYKDWRLIILDDCSTDSTADIAMEYSKKYSGKIKFYRNSKNSKSAKNAFFELFKHSESDYIMLCDQDDVWKENKIEITFNKMLESEKAYGKELPILV